MSSNFSCLNNILRYVWSHFKTCNNKDNIQINKCKSVIYLNQNVKGILEFSKAYWKGQD
jgi:hypothetical protein